MRNNRNVRTGMNRTGFVKAVGAGAAAIAGASMFGSNVAHANGVKPTWILRSLLPTFLDFGSNLTTMTRFINDASGYVNVSWQAITVGWPAVTGPTVTDNVIVSGTADQPTGQAFSELWLELLWHNPALGFTPELMRDWLFDNGGILLVETYLDQFQSLKGYQSVKVLPVVVNPGDGGGGYFKERFTPGSVNGVLPYTRMRESGPILAEIAPFVGIGPKLAFQGLTVVFDLKRLALPESDGISLQAFGFHTLPTDVSLWKALKVSPADYGCTIVYEHCPFGGAAVFFIYVPERLYLELEASMPGAWQAVLNAAKANVNDNITRYNMEYSNAIAYLVAEGLKVQPAWPTQLLDRVDRVAKAKYAEWRREDPKFDAVLTSMENFLNGY